MLFKQGAALYSYELEREAGENVIYINYLGAPFVPGLADYGEVMSRTIDYLSENSNVSRVVFVQQRNYCHDFRQVRMLVEVAQIYDFLIKQEKILSPDKMPQIPGVFATLNYIFNEVFKRDPIKAYRELKGVWFEQKARNQNGSNEPYIKYLERIISFLDGIEIIKTLKVFFDTYRAGDRAIYNEVFRPDIIPNFTFTRMAAVIPEDADILAQYEIAKGYDKSQVTVYTRKDDIKPVYHITPPEYTLNEEHHLLLNLARNVLIEHQPKQEEFSDPERTRQVFFNVARDLVQDLAGSKNISLSYSELNKLAMILVRHTIGFGVIEVILQDDELQDIVINSPISLTPIFVKHNRFDECSSNIIPSQEDAESWAAKFRMLSGRALDEANPVLDTSLNLGEIGARVAIIQQPLSPGGLAYALRRHRNKPWTLPLFIKNKMMSPLAAGVLNFLIDGSRTMLIAGTRSSGKTSLLGSLMLEIMPKFRIITCEDTLELPISNLRNLGYDVLSMKVRSALTEESNEVGADEGIRASLRLGDSSLIIGEIRSGEAKALYEAMRIGALANVVAGTIHGSSPYSVFDRVVNDLGVPVTSFKATDCIVVANPIKSADGLHSFRRLLQIAEIRKHWTKDPLDEQGFVDLLKYNVDKDVLEVSDDLINGDSDIIKDIASNVRGWAGNWDAIWDNIVLRGKVREELVNYSQKATMPDLLEAGFVVQANNAFHKISEKIQQEVGLPVSERVLPEWKLWLDREARKLQIG
jgi:type IV secretory pathway ATPase VirB11/archaellum biosynthesis ATPase